MNKPRKKFNRKAIFSEVDASNVRMSKMSRADRRKFRPMSRLD